MNNDWQSFLEQQGAAFSDGKVQDYGNPEQELEQALAGNTLCDLSHDALIRAKGDDCIDFLQGQLTNDVRNITPEQHQLSSYCSPKGRILSLFRLFMRDGAYYLQLPASLLPTTLKRLQMFVLMSKVELSDASAELARFSLSGPSVAGLLEQHLGKIPSEEGQAATLDNVTVLRVGGIQPRFILHAEPARLAELWQALQNEGVMPIGAAAGRLQEIHAGLPAVYPETVEAFVPQMVNLQLVNGVSFKKGCYTGQEVVARMQYLGKLKRRMYLAHIETSQPPVPGDKIASPDSTSGQGAGKVVNVAPAPQGGYDILAVIEIASADGALHLDERPDDTLQILPLPYSTETAEAAAN